MLVNPGLHMSGYNDETAPAMQKRMIDTVETIPGVLSAGLVNWPPLTNGAGRAALVFSDEAAELIPANAAATPMILKISPDYFRAAQTALLSGRNLTLYDDANAPPVAVVNSEFARKIFGSESNALDRISRCGMERAFRW